MRQIGEVSYENRNKIKIMPSERKNTEKRDILREASQAAFDYSDKITQTRVSYLDSSQEVLIINS